MLSRPCGAPRAEACNELKVRTVHQCKHRRVNLGCLKLNRVMAEKVVAVGYPEGIWIVTDSDNKRRRRRCDQHHVALEIKE